MTPNNDLTRPRIGVSACLMGRPVRPDGKDKHVVWITQTLSTLATLVAICPEIEMGLGVPRERIDFGLRDGRQRLVGLSSGRDLTDIAEATSQRLLNEQAVALDGYIFKRKSASCGLEKGGLFARAFTARYPEVPVIEEDKLADADARDAFLAQARYRFAIRTR